MGKIVVSEHVSLDGVVQDPTGEEGFERGGWFLRMSAGDREAWAELALAEARGADALLLGRRSDDWFAARWPARTGEWADRLNGLRKYVVSATLDEPRWSNATVLGGDPVEEVSALGRDVDGDVVVYASAGLVRTLLEHDLVDELRLVVHPVVLGAGRRLFGDTTTHLRLVGVRTVGDDLALLTYRRP
ncbi:dihydrofolate reductase family protein [Pseudonocardia yuanmonensis]|uniref:Dihydrofolate reductase family protein n=2 Tax=Pseudonocardia yuanmonensis TaxID=1095914 RepID=A0ABP8XLU2_9PSEU